MLAPDSASIGKQGKDHGSLLPFVKLPRALLPIYLTTFMDMLGYTLLIPLLPALAKKYGAHDWLVGMLLSIPALCSTFAAPLWGKTSDWIGRKFIILIAQGFTLAGYLLLAVAPSFFWVLISRVISGIGAGSIGTAESYIADVTTDEQRSKAFVFFGATFGSAFVIGPLIAGSLVHYDIQFPFFVAAGLEVVNILIAITLLPARTRQTREKTSLHSSLKTIMLPLIRIVLVRQFLFIFSVVYLLADFALYLNDALHESMQHATWMLAGAGITGALTMLLVVVPLIKRRGEQIVGQLGLMLLFVAYALIYFVQSVNSFFPVLVFWAAGAAMVEPTLTTMLSERAPETERGSVMGMSDALNSVALIFAPAVGTAIVGAEPRLIGILPGLAVAGAWFLGRFCERGFEAAENATAVKPAS